MEISFSTIEQIAKENNIEIKIFAEPIHKDINEAEVSENQILKKKNEELRKQNLDLQKREQEYCNKISNLEKEKTQLEEKIGELEKEKLEKETREIEVPNEFNKIAKEIKKENTNDKEKEKIHGGTPRIENNLRGCDIKEETGVILNMPKDIVKEIEKIKNTIKSYNWNKTSDDWIVRIPLPPRYNEYKTIAVDPFSECSKTNPLYRLKKWVERIYNEKNLNLSDEKLAIICGLTKNGAYYWRKKLHKIEGKHEWGAGRWIDNRSGRIYIRAPKGYNNPYKKSRKIGDKTYLLEHRFLMEQFLIDHPEVEASKKFLIQEKYLNPKCEIHHINMNPQDNRIENLWIFKDKKAHAEGEKTIYNTLRIFIDSNLIKFKEGEYFLSDDFASSPILKSQVKKINKKNELNFEIIKEKIKKIDWKNISENWEIKIPLPPKYDNFKEITLNPTRDCSENNPLYRHKKWFERIYNDKRFLLSDAKIASMYNLTREKIRYWRQRVHKIKGRKEWGANRIIDKRSGRIWIRVPKNYDNPVVKKEDGTHRRIMMEHRYLMEQYLAKHPEWEISRKVLIDEKYLKQECQVHHINLNYQDNRLENLWVYENNSKHLSAQKKLFNFIEQLVNSGRLIFKDGKYIIAN